MHPLFQPRRSSHFTGLLAAALLLSACSGYTPYQRIGNRRDGGYSHSRQSDNTYTVTYQGTEFSKPEQIYDYALLRCAELTVECGYKFFVVNSNNERSRTAYRYTPGFAPTRTTEYRTTSSGYTYRYTSTTPGTPGHSHNVKIPAYALSIKMYADVTGVRAPASDIHEAAPLIVQLKAKHKLK